MAGREFKKLALMGLATGLLVSAESAEAKQALLSRIGNFELLAAAVNPDGSKDFDPNDGNMGYHVMTEDELLLELNDEGTKLYNSLTPEDKALVLKVASMRCQGTNECKHLNACKTDHNDCAGKGECKGKGKCALADKNLAVKLVYDKMKEKRMGVIK